MHRRAIAAALAVAALIIAPAALITHANRPTIRQSSIVNRVTRNPVRVPRYEKYVSDTSVSAKRRGDVGPPATLPALIAIANAGRAVSEFVAALPTTTTSTTTLARAPPVRSAQCAACTSPPTSIVDVMACIRNVESGDYGNHSNGPEGASGAYQYIGSTWRAWSARAGYPGTSAAWMASPATQDAVTVYTLTHGGAHNWDPRYGADSCTVGLP